MSELLELDAVEVSYGQAKALDGVSLKVPEGKIVSLLGGNASGKSTTMKTILRTRAAGNGAVCCWTGMTSPGGRPRGEWPRGSRRFRRRAASSGR